MPSAPHAPHSPDGPGPDTAPALGRVRDVAARLLGLSLLVLWACWWIKSYRHDRMESARLTWHERLPFLAGDFKVHIDHTARQWAAGVNVYRAPCDWVCQYFPYPPMVPRLFTWVSLFDTPTAIGVWLVLLTSILALGAWGAWRTRRALGLGRMPLSLTIACLLFSTPVVMTVERGQCDGLVILLLLAGAGLLARNRPAAQFGAGGLLALAAWIKYYPGLCLVGLLAMRRYRAVAGFVLLGGVVAAHDARDVHRSIASGQHIAASMNSDRATGVHHGQHALTVSWRPLWRRTRHYDFLADIPAPAATAVLVLLPLAWVSWHVSRHPTDPRLVYPYLTWLVALGTFAMPYSNDYNLVFLPLVLLMVWSRDDPVPVHMIYGTLLLWLQPLWLPIGGELLLAVKYAGVVACGASLVTRTRRLAAPASGVPLARPHQRPARRLVVDA